MFGSQRKSSDVPAPRKPNLFKFLDQISKYLHGPAFLAEESVSEEKKAADKAAVEQLSLQEGEGEDISRRQRYMALSSG